MHQFLGYTFDPHNGELTRDGQLLPLEWQPSQVLGTLVAASGRMVTRAALIDEVWGRETHGNFDDNLNYCIRHLRRVLGDDARAPRFIETLPKRGYRFIAPVAATVPARPHRWWQLAGATAAAVLLVIVESTPNNHHEVMADVLRRLHAFVF